MLERVPDGGELHGGFLRARRRRLFPSFKISFSFSSKMRRKMFVSEVDKTSVCSNRVIFVLFDEVFALVRHVAGVMVQRKIYLRPFWFRKIVSRRPTRRRAFAPNCSGVVDVMMHDSSKRLIIPPTLRSMTSKMSWLSTNSIYDQSMASFSYSSCSILNTFWLKCCCNFSLAKLMQNCSKEFF